MWPFTKKPAPDNTIKGDLTAAVVEGLNLALAQDRRALQKLCDARVTINAALASAPVPFVISDGPTLGPIGLINGVLNLSGAGRVAAVYEADGKLSGFKACDKNGNVLP